MNNELKTVYVQLYGFAGQVDAVLAKLHTEGMVYDVEVNIVDNEVVEGV